MVHPGTRAPDFTAVTTTGKSFTLSAHLGKVVVLFFFPKAFTPGCSREASQFASSWEQFESMGAEVLGISTDDLQTQCDFASALKLPFPLIADTGAKICNLYGATWPILDLARRYTFVIDPIGVVRNVFKHEILVGKHVSEARAAIQKLKVD
jgi:peroxiredoxin